MCKWSDPNDLYTEGDIWDVEMSLKTNEKEVSTLKWNKEDTEYENNDGYKGSSHSEWLKLNGNRIYSVY